MQHLQTQRATTYREVQQQQEKHEHADGCDAHEAVDAENGDAVAGLEVENVVGLALLAVCDGLACAFVACRLASLAYSNSI